uniref:Uncharacterized protein n=1 Tax=viral metagenome TaxID=1070528 RepID=A0A6C0DLV0_9ZZZZ
MLDASHCQVIYSYNYEFNCAVLSYNDKYIYVDCDDLMKVLNFKKNFTLNNNEDDYPSFGENYKKYFLIEFLYKFDMESVTYVFLNNNKYDLRKCNVEIYHKYHREIAKSYKIIKYIPGHFKNRGISANQMKNPLWIVEENGENIILMYCEKDTIVKLCEKSYKEILDFENQINEKVTFFLQKNGYIATHIPKCKGDVLYIHQIITGCYGNGKGTADISVDHIDRNPLNNTYGNLRTATQKMQQLNSIGIMPGTKKERQQKARPLPEGIQQSMMRKYVVYYYNVYNKEKNLSREYFRVEGHPKLEKIWETTKSEKVSILEKLRQANKVVDDLENDIYPEKQQSKLPKYVSIILFRNKEHLYYDKRGGETRKNLKMVLPTEYNINEQIKIFNEKIKEKYDGESIIT